MLRDKKVVGVFLSRFRAPLATTVGGTASNLEYTLVDTNASNGTTGTLYPSQTNTTGIFTNLPVADYLITVRT
jgi:hypothetical protein